MLYLIGELTISDPVLETAGELNKVTWTVGTENATAIDDFPDNIKGGHKKREWIESKGYYGKLYNMGSNNLQPLTLTWNGLTLERAKAIFDYYMKRKYVMADYRGFSGKLARITNMRIKPFWGSDFVGVTITVAEVPAFRVYRSVDYGESYQQASDRVNNEFYDYGFVYAGQVRYRVQYDPPDAEATFDGILDYPTQETTRESIAGWKRNTENIPIVETYTAGGSTGSVAGDFAFSYPIAGVSDVISISVDGEDVPHFYVFSPEMVQEYISENGVMSVGIDQNGRLKFFVGNGTEAVPSNVEGTIRAEYIPKVIPTTRTLGVQYEPPELSVAGAMKISDIFVAHGIKDVPSPKPNNQYYLYIPPPNLDKIEGNRMYDEEGIKPSVLVYFEYPHNAFDIYPSTVITNEIITITLTSGEGTTTTEAEGLTPIEVEAPSIGWNHYTLTVRSENAYGKTPAKTFEGDVWIPELPYNDNIDIGDPTAADPEQETVYTNILKRTYSDIHTPQLTVTAMNFTETSIPHTPPDMNELDGGTYTDTWETPYTEVYTTEVTQNSDYSEIHYT